uniref:Uncharacterized protein n=1 Tax=Rhizophora mucronata TaxID=61149 RepID=A0A2P2R1E5_RHIMU
MQQSMAKKYALAHTMNPMIANTLQEFFRYQISATFFPGHTGMTVVQRELPTPVVRPNPSRKRIKL